MTKAEIQGWALQASEPGALPEGALSNSIRARKSGQKKQHSRKQRNLAHFAS
jgi:hypothetical protein